MKTHVQFEKELHKMKAEALESIKEWMDERDNREHKLCIQCGSCLVRKIYQEDGKIFVNEIDNDQEMNFTTERGWFYTPMKCLIERLSLYDLIDLLKGLELCDCEQDEECEEY